MKYDLYTDVNGNKTLKVSVRRGPQTYRIRVQTNGVLPLTHRHGIGPQTAREFAEYVDHHGTGFQKHLLSVCRLRGEI